LVVRQVGTQARLDPRGPNERKEPGELMKVCALRKHILVLSALLGALLMVAPLRAQTPATATGSLRGQVTDPSGAAVTAATILLTTPSGDSIDTATNKEGIYEFKNLAPGKYGVKAVAQGFGMFTLPSIEIVAGQLQKLNIAMKIEEQEEKVLVTDTTTKVDVDPANNAGAVVLRGKDLDALSDDPDELQSELQALAGPSAGPNGGQIYIDGFTAGQLPPKASIREIRVNQNPFSSEYDKLGYGRIEILTKPGTDQFHGQIFASGNSSGFNARNPFEVLPAGVPAPGYESTQFSGNVGGPLSKKASFFFNIERRDIHDLSFVSTPFVDPTTFQITQFSQTVPNPKVRWNLSPRLDYQVTPSNTLTARYQYFRNTETSDDVGQFALAAQGVNTLGTEHQLQVSDTQTLSARTINETRFQYVHSYTSQIPTSLLPAISVIGAFQTGGNTGGTSMDTQNRYELQNITYMNFGKHALKFGGRLRATQDDNQADARFNSAYTFSSLQSYQTTLMETAAAQPLTDGPSFYSLSFNTVGTARAQVTYFDAGLFVQDDWRIKPNITLSYGLRYESQNYLSDHHDFAPRFGLAWGIGGDGKNKSPKTVIRAGWGIFYDRFTSDLVLNQQLQNGLIQQNYLIPNPGFFNPNAVVTPSQIPNPATSPQTTYVLNPNLRTPYTMQTGISVERQLGKFANVAVTYLNSRGNHELYTEFTNPNAAGSPPPSNLLYEYQSEGVFKQNQFIINSSVRLPTKISVSLFGYYTLNYANSDTNGAGTIPSNPTNLSEDYGRAAFDTRQRLFVGGSIGLPKGFRFSPFLIASSGSPFNITTGQDLFGDSTFNIRPFVATCSGTLAPSVVQTKYGCFSLVPNGEPVIPIYDATGPDRFALNVRLSKTFGLGKKLEGQNPGAQGGPGAGGTFGRGPGGGGGRGPGPGGGRGGFDSASSGQRYSLTFSISAQNLFNDVNLGNPTGNLSSPLFGISNSLAGRPFSSGTSNRRLDLQVTFSF
jgi:Carboxypeptidase regulatory-like domain